MPRAGFGWTDMLIPGTGKIMTGQIAMAHYQKLGADAPGWFTTSNESRLEQMIGDLLPPFIPYYKEHSTHVKSMGYTLSHRAEKCLPPDLYSGGKNEIERFLKPDYAAIYRGVETALAKNKPITNDRLQELREQTLILTSSGHCVYLRSTLADIGRIYIGETEDIAKRNGGHLNSDLFLSDVFSMPNAATRLSVEKALHSKVRKIGGVPLREDRPTRGLFRLPPGINARDAMLAIFHNDYRFFLHNTGQCDLQGKIK
jgi:hypothetical protein